MRHDHRGSWYLLTGLVLGLATGLIYSWVVSPVEYVDAPPYALRADYKDEYRVLVAEAYLYSGDILRAVDRLEQLRDHNISQSLTMQAQQALAENKPEKEIRALSLLTLALGEGLTPAASNATPMQTPGNTQPARTIQPTIPATPTQGAPFELVETKQVCNPDQTQPFIQVMVQDAAGQPISSVELVVTWDGGEDHLVTGLMPELSPGYAEFSMALDVVYSLRLAEGGQTMNDITASKCDAEDGSQYWGSWMFIYSQP